jgi:hypothetical protein
LDEKNKIPFAFRLLYLFLAGIICYLYYKKIVEPVNFDAENSINRVLSFQTPKPYQFRMLVPFIFVLFKPLWFISQKTIFIIYDFVIVYLIVIVFHKVLSQYIQNKKAILWLSPVILYPMLWNYIILNQGFMYYDFTSILIFTIGLYFILKEKFGYLLIVFIVGLVNKETIAYLGFAYVFFNYKILFTKKIILNLLLLSAIFVAYKLLLNYLFQNNSGSTVEICFAANKITLKELPYNRVYQKDVFLNFGLLYVPALFIFLTGKWKKFPDRRKVSINLVFLPYLLFGIFIIYFSEIRVYAELIPGVTLLFIVYLSAFKKLNLQPVNDAK